MLSNCSAGEDSWESLGQQRDQTIQSWGHDPWIFIGCWSWRSDTLATWCKELTHWKRPWCWERLMTGWNGWMASLAQWTWVWANSGRWWSTGKPGVLQSMGLQGYGHSLAMKQQYIRIWFRNNQLPWFQFKIIYLKNVRFTVQYLRMVGGFAKRK